ncbi:alpha-D-ribose 1-methylphosphonate 5-triphosphate diphosphatase [Saccharopolyspora pogona]|uniref:alpha-D-ribose 1-methylphosphonate 5-triphosphate diphosphatase n=1 Tax=Saccharopolyspora pogona TaxID=333966 RepID=UPI0016886709|nr:alpha-D-ribose 1-methylphosphonate 5-triphosphate diphosphatase [Saccharopolyspora pogona]
MSTPVAETWTPAAPPADYVLGHVRAVLPGRVLDNARIVVRDGRIAAVEPHPAGSGSDVDGQDLLCVPGLIDTHSDGLENERMPRPSVEVPIEFAIQSFEGKLRAAGVTTVFHGVGFEERSVRARGKPRTVRQAEYVCQALDAYEDGLLDHRILYRLDVRSAEGLAALCSRLDQAPDGALVSHEDHTPGQGQFTDLAEYTRWMIDQRGMTDDEAREHVDQTIANRDSLLNVRDEAFRWLASRTGRIRVMGHDPGSAGEIADLLERGGSIAEFPTTIEAAQAARDHGMPVVMGAPNILRGRSQSGNVSGRDLLARGLVTGLASDYLPSSLLAAAILLAEDGLATLPAAIGLVTGGAADVAGLADRGRLDPGLRADLVLVEPCRPWARVRAVLWGGR